MPKLPQNNKPLNALELFCGMGGLSWGFAKTGFQIMGIDISEKAGLTFSHNKLGKFLKKDLTQSEVFGRQKYAVILGGPPCEPWSCLNLRKRGKEHPLYNCLSAFFREIHRLKPPVFVMENVPAIQKDPLLLQNLEATRKYYDLSSRIFKYSDYGAAFARHRLFIIGVKTQIGVLASDIADSIQQDKLVTVRQAIEDLKDKPVDRSIDHVWPNVKTIRKYLDYYQTGKYGWYILEWDKSSPSFGNITKTYILHPDSFNDGIDARPISIREALRIVGFPDSYKFPEGIDMRTKYEMIAEAVSPIFSLKLAKAVKRMLMKHAA
jgi:DNA (cytosine-5)-methyltransferase 1